MGESAGNMPSLKRGGCNPNEFNQSEAMRLGTRDKNVITLGGGFSDQGISRNDIGRWGVERKDFL